MKKIAILISIILILYTKVAYSDINLLLGLELHEVSVINTTNSKIHETNIVETPHELYVEQTAGFGYNFLKFNLESKLYYRKKLYSKREGYLWADSKFDIGIENNFSLSSDTIGVFLDIRPLSFFGIRSSFNFIYMYNIMNFGYAGFESNSGINYSANTLFGLEKTDAIGFMGNIAPYLLLKFPTFTLINSLNLNFIFMGDMPYYYDPRTAILHSQSELELFNDLYIFANINEVYFGMHYGLTYLLTSKIMAHKLGINSALHFIFLNHRLVLDIIVEAGLHVGLPNYNNVTYIELKSAISYKII